ncbi:DTW domain-containing protein [Fimicolochytrium jonesii]|uniref:DTW domain-containing protein n=1 Tax=Fimicolochytrium jonesii TaxID=1396493 RepID=UPI0022FDCCD8|nr:DTW domain-containing protein [Fimicolochytrium jonesii]KAI8823961.1 DTW domain-containing protein [Fimicolochytrium jonesii]
MPSNNSNDTPSSVTDPAASSDTTTASQATPTDPRSNPQDASNPKPTDPFTAFRITDPSPISHLYTQPRLKCPQCNKGYKIYCPRCGIPLGHEPPKVELPIKVICYRDPREVEAKSTSAHAQILAKGNVTVVVENVIQSPETSSISSLPHPEKVLLLFPSPTALPLSEIPNLAAFDRLIVLDGTWKQGRAMAGAIKGVQFQHVAIQERSTLFWRYQPFGETHLSTIEALYWFFRDYFDAMKDKGEEEYDGRFDDLLYYFRLQWGLIQDVYRADTGKRFTQRKLDAKDYIRY